MSGLPPLPYSLSLRLLRLSLVLGVADNAIFAVLLVVAPNLPGRWLGLTLPPERFQLWLVAIFLGMLAVFYTLAAFDPVAYWGNILVVIGGRLAGAGALTLAICGQPELSGLWPVVASNLVLGLLHAFFWWPVRRWDLLRSSH